MKITEFIEKNKDLEISKFVYNFGSYVYFICEDDGIIIYIGTTANLQTRMKVHLASIDFAEKDIYYFEYPLADCKKLEKELISRINPSKNNQNNHGRGIRHDYGGTNLLKTKQIKKDLKKLLKSKRITQSQIAKKMGFSRQRIHQILNATNLHNSTIEKIEKLITE